MLGVIAAVAFFAESLMFEGVGPSSIVAFLGRVELVKLVGEEWGDAKEGSEEDFRVFIISGENRFDRKWGERDVNDSQSG